MNFVDDDESIMIQKDEKQKKNYRYLKVDLEEGKDGRRVKMMSTPASLTTNAGSSHQGVPEKEQRQTKTSVCFTFYEISTACIYFISRFWFICF